MEREVPGLFWEEGNWMDDQIFEDERAQGDHLYTSTLGLLIVPSFFLLR